LGLQERRYQRVGLFNGVFWESHGERKPQDSGRVSSWLFHHRQRPVCFGGLEMRLKGLIFTIDGIISLAFLVAASLMVLNFYHLPFEESKSADAQQLGFDYLNMTYLMSMGPQTSPTGLLFDSSTPADNSFRIHALLYYYPQENGCVNTAGPDFQSSDPNCKHAKEVWVK
jgi:hypothetical protein